MSMFVSVPDRSPDHDVYARCLDDDLRVDATVTAHIHDKAFATDLYRALCNNLFVHKENAARHSPEHSGDAEIVIKGCLAWGCSWRRAGEIVAQLRAQSDPAFANEDYLDYYCSGGESTVTDDVRALLVARGWTIHPYPPSTQLELFADEDVLSDDGSSTDL